MLLIIYVFLRRRTPLISAQVESRFEATDSKFLKNSAQTNGAVAYVTQSGKFILRNSSLENDLYLTRAGTAEIYNSSFNGSLNCEVSGTTLAALLLVDLNRTRFSLDPNCVVFLYRVNNDGSAEFKNRFENSVLQSSGVIDHVYWTTPCISVPKYSDFLIF